MSTKNWGFDVRDMDTNVRPQDDFFHYSNGGWMKRNPVPPSESRWGTFMKLRYMVDRQLHTMLVELEMKKAPAGSPAQMIRDFFKSGMDMKRRNALDIRPLDSYRTLIANIRTTKDMERVIALLARIGVHAPWSAHLDQDDKDSRHYVLRLTQGGIGLPDRDYYLKDDAESLRVRNGYKIYVERTYRLMGYAPSTARTATVEHMKLETALAEASMSKVERRDPYKTYTKMTIAHLRTTAPSIDWASYLKRIGASGLASVIVNQPKFLKEVSKLLKDVPLEKWKQYLDWHLVHAYGGALSARFLRVRFAFYGPILTGKKRMQPLWRRVLMVVNGELGEQLGKLYVEKYFPPEAKRKMGIMVADLFEAFEARIRQLDWMSAGTKKKALNKLRALTPKIGYPNKWRSYKGLVIRPNDYVGNIVRATEFEHLREMRKLKRPVDRNEWFMDPQDVNAYFSPNLNDIVFPAAILQPPFFNLKGEDAINYGAIGAVIGHEMTHGFDDSGAKFDAKGNLKSWWTTEDKKRFEKRAEVLRKQFDEYTVADGVKVNGKLTLGENIADLGGAAIALDAYRLRAAKDARVDIDGFSPTQRFFLGFAVFECENMRPEAQKMQVLTDPHSPGKFRINGPASNLLEFYEAFGTKKGDALYRDPKNRAKIW